MSSTSARSVDRVLVTGAAGYVGSVLVRRLLAAGISVVGVDRLDFGSHAVDDLTSRPDFDLLIGDVRDVGLWEPALAKSDAVIHLAAIVGDPACKQQPDEAVSVNVNGSLALFQYAVEASRPQRFVFASTCSNYGRHPDFEYCDEGSALRPLSLYAETKVQVEETVLGHDGGSAIVPTCLRFATAFGLSPRMRFDLTVNEFAREMFDGRTLEVYGEQFWRPYCHTEDIADACLAALRAPASAVANRAFNIGSTANNHTKAEIVGLLQERLPKAPVQYVRKDDDPRSYKVDCTRAQDELGFRPQRTVADGIDEILDALANTRFAGIPDARLRNTVAA
ncbi:MAG: NAD-dependent epimerase/dehydratase family protein [Acidobacteria bacterium]|nr:NAD-dependent epimerase/dehydratase family protein [Acidobacteriota bacterium]